MPESTRRSAMQAITCGAVGVSQARTTCADEVAGASAPVAGLAAAGVARPSEVSPAAPVSANATTRARRLPRGVPIVPPLRGVDVSGDPPLSRVDRGICESGRIAGIDVHQTDGPAIEAIFRALD